MWPSSEGPGCVKLRGGGGDGGSPRVGIPGTLAWGGQRPGMEGWSPRAAPGTQSLAASLFSSEEGVKFCGRNSSRIYHHPQKSSQ